MMLDEADVGWGCLGCILYSTQDDRGSRRVSNHSLPPRCPGSSNGTRAKWRALVVISQIMDSRGCTGGADPRNQCYRLDLAGLKRGDILCLCSRPHLLSRAEHGQLRPRASISVWGNIRPSLDFIVPLYSPSISQTDGAGREEGQPPTLASSLSMTERERERETDRQTGRLDFWLNFIATLKYCAMILFF